MCILHMHRWSSIIIVIGIHIPNNSGHMEKQEMEMEMQPLSCCSQAILGAGVH